MILTTKSRYAVMAMVDLASQGASQGEDRRVCLADIAARQDIPQNYLEQIFCKLKQSGLVKSVRGPGGGYSLAQASEHVFISHIMEAVDEQVKMTRCNHDPAKGCMSKKARCLTHDLWDGLTQQIQGYLSNISLADICDKQIKPVATERRVMETAV